MRKSNYRLSLRFTVAAKTLIAICIDYVKSDNEFFLQAKNEANGNSQIGVVFRCKITLIPSPACYNVLLKEARSFLFRLGPSWGRKWIRQAWRTLKFWTSLTGSRELVRYANESLLRFPLLHFADSSLFLHATFSNLVWLLCSTGYIPVLGLKSRLPFLAMTSHIAFDTSNYCYHFSFSIFPTLSSCNVSSLPTSHLPLLVLTSLSSLAIFQDFPFPSLHFLISFEFPLPTSHLLLFTSCL